MAIIFPKDPYPGILFSAGDYTWTWDGAVWNLLPPDTESYNTIELIPGVEPNGPLEGTLAIADGIEWDPAENGDQVLMVYLNGQWESVALGENYILPVATTSVLGGVKIDGVTVIINNGVISALAGGSVALTNSFANISVPGQPTLVAESDTDTLNIIAGTGISITTNAASDTITINSTVSIDPSSSDFSLNIAGDDSTQRVISNNETIKFIGGTGISTTTDSEGNVTITNTASGGSANFSSLTDASTASLTIDQIYLPAVTRLNVGNVGASAYTFDQYSGNNPTVYAVGGMTIAFKLNVSGHPFLIQDGAGTNYNSGLVHVSSTGVVNTGASAQGQVSGTLYWKVPASVSGNYRYQCSAHVAMVGVITVKNIVSL